jgi:hypothetical protein
MTAKHGEMPLTVFALGYSRRRLLMPKWTMPKWMEAYREFICNTGGNTVERLMNGTTNPIVNLPLSTLECAVKSQVILLEILHKNGKLV